MQNLRWPFDTIDQLSPLLFQVHKSFHTQTLFIGMYCTKYVPNKIKMENEKIEKCKNKFSFSDMLINYIRNVCYQLIYSIVSTKTHAKIIC